MARPRQIVPGRTYLITRRTSQQQFFLRPSPETNAILAYCVARAQQLNRMSVHAVSFQSDHAHIEVTDDGGCMPSFCEHLFGLIARAMNALLGRSENFWAPGPYHAGWLPKAADQMRGMVYTSGNPARHDLVERALDWPGVVTLPHHFGPEPILVPRPKTFFRQEGPRALPEVIPLRLSPPPAFSHLPRDAFRWQFAEALAEYEELRQQRRGGRPVLGAVAVLAAKPTDRPRGAAPLREAPRHYVSAEDPDVREAAIQGRQRFLEAYDEANARWRQGERDVVFPYGTYQLRRRSAVRVEPPPD